jgi:hypothetical protein
MSTTHADAAVAHVDQAVDETQELTTGTRPPTPLRELVRTYVVYSVCSIPLLVDWSPKIFSVLLSIPVVSSITQAIVRVTFFNQVRPLDYHPSGLAPLCLLIC